MLLHGDKLSALPRGLQNQFLVQRLDGRHVDDPDGDTLGGKGPPSLDGLWDHDARGDDGGVRTVLEDLAPADLKMVVLAVEHRSSSPAEAHIDGALHLIGGLHHLPGLHVVGGAHDGHAGNGAHEGEVLTALVGRAVLAHRDPAVGGPDFHIQVGISDGIADLLIGPPGGKHGEGGGEGHQPHGGKAGGHIDHIGLGDAAVEVTLGECLLKDIRLGCPGQVRVRDHQVLRYGPQLLEGAAVAVAGSDFFHICHDYTSSALRAWESSSMPLAYSSSLGALPCQPALSSI